MSLAMQTVHVINPSNQTVLKNITSYNGTALSAQGSLGGSTNKSLTWNDLVFATVRAPVLVQSTICCWHFAKGHKEHDWAQISCWAGWYMHKNYFHSWAFIRPVTRLP